METEIDLTNKKPSELIRIAIEDLTKCEKDPRYKIEMSEWHSPHIDLCYVCLAGAVLAQTYKFPINIYINVSLGDIDNEKIMNILYAINRFRIGDVSHGLKYLGYEAENTYDRTIRTTLYYRNPNQFKEEMLALAYDLEKDGL